jgi:hypothetical protein
MIEVFEVFELFELLLRGVREEDVVGEMEIGDASRLCFVFRDKVNRRGCGWRKCNGSVVPLFCVEDSILFA